MTEKQVKALVKIYNEMAIIFDHFVIITADKERDHGEILPDPNLFWYGGYVNAKYMIDDAAGKIDRRKFRQVSPEKLIKET